jgi:hypothetical protein
MASHSFFRSFYKAYNDTPTKGTIMFDKKKFEDAKAKAYQLMQERPLETLAVASAAIVATAKLISSVTEARNSATWKREVRRREDNQRTRYYNR